MFRTVLAILSLLFAAPFAQAQHFTPEELHDRAIEGSWKFPEAQPVS